ncbi:MAG: HEAT repeat domain-containing protein [Ruminococcaceae bacterium]|nr:HEAT repeat domain-containing protein [Oscillospiraceae bacterium]
MKNTDSIVFERVELFLLQCFRNGITPFRYFSVHFLEGLIKSSTEELRSVLAKSLACGDTRAVSLLIELSKDEDEFVRLEAIDSLSNFPCEESYLAFCDGVKDESDLVRAYSFWGLSVASGERHKRDAQILLRTAASKEQSPRIYVDIYAGLYNLGEKERLEDLLRLFDVGNYQVKCAILHTLEDIADAENIERILLFLASRRNDDNGYAVSDTMHSIYHYLKTAGQQVAQRDEGTVLLSRSPQGLPHPPQCDHWGTFPKGKA